MWRRRASCRALNDAACARLRALALIAVKPARMNGELSAFERHDVRDGVIQQRPVVRNDDRRIGIAAKVCLKPDRAFKVEIVGWLVEEEKVGR